MADDLLRRAAAHARYLAGDPADWDMDSDDWSRFTVYEDHGIERTTIATSTHPTLSVHIATWNPAVAHLVADWLEHHALQHDAYECDEDNETNACPALAVARAITLEDLNDALSKEN